MKLVVGARYSREEKTGTHIRSFFPAQPNALFRVVGTGHFNTPLQVADIGGYASAPLTYGVTLKVSF